MYLKLQVIIPYFLRGSMFGMFLLVFCIIRVVEEFDLADFAFVEFFHEVEFVIMLPVWLAPHELCWTAWTDPLFSSCFPMFFELMPF